MSRVALEIAVEEGGSPVLDLALRRVRESGDGAMRERLLVALAAAEAPALSESVLALTRDSLLGQSERRGVLWEHALSPASGGKVLAALERDPEAVLSVFPPSMVGRAPLLFSRRCEVREAERVRAVFEALRDRLPQARRALDQTLEAIRLCAARNAADGDAAARWLVARAGPPPGHTSAPQ